MALAFATWRIAIGIAGFDAAELWAEIAQAPHGRRGRVNEPSILTPMQGVRDRRR